MHLKIMYKNMEWKMYVRHDQNKKMQVTLFSKKVVKWKVQIYHPCNSLSVSDNVKSFLELWVCTYYNIFFKFKKFGTRKFFWWYTWQIFPHICILICLFRGIRKFIAKFLSSQLCKVCALFGYWISGESKMTLYSSGSTRTNENFHARINSIWQ